jgi:hypothetical protein
MDNGYEWEMQSLQDRPSSLHKILPGFGKPEWSGSLVPQIWAKKQRRDPPRRQVQKYRHFCQGIR